MRIEGKLFNSATGDFIASGPCEVNRDRAEVTMWPSWQTRPLDRERGQITLVLEGGETLQISDRHLTFRLRSPSEERISVFRLRVLGRLERVPEHLRTDYQEPGATGPTSASTEGAATPNQRGS